MQLTVSVKAYLILSTPMLHDLSAAFRFFCSLKAPTPVKKHAQFRAVLDSGNGVLSHMCIVYATHTVKTRLNDNTLGGRGW